MPEEYVCTLDEASLKKAREELGEDPSQRLGAVEALRTWVDQQPHLRYPTDDIAMLQMLRYGKFSQLRARETIENYCTMISKRRDWYSNHDTSTAIFQKFVEMGYIVPLPKRIPTGEKLCVMREGAYNPAEWKAPEKKTAMIKCFNAVFLSILRDEATMVNGVVYLMDMSSTTMAHHTFWSGDETKEIMHAWQKSIPNRYKAFYAYNIGAIFELMYEFSKPFMGKKMKERLHVIGNNMEKLYKYIPKDCLPLDYLPDDYKGPNVGTLKDVIAAQLSELRSAKTVEYLKMISSPEWGIISENKPRDVPVASFRKLNID